MKLYFIKKWAQKQMNELESDDDEYIEEDMRILGERKRKKEEMKKPKRRNAIVMAEVDDSEQSKVFSNKEEVARN